MTEQNVTFSRTNLVSTATIVSADAESGDQEIINEYQSRRVVFPPASSEVSLTAQFDQTEPNLTVGYVAMVDPDMEPAADVRFEILDDLDVQVWDSGWLPVTNWSPDNARPPSLIYLDLSDTPISDAGSLIASIRHQVADYPNGSPNDYGYRMLLAGDTWTPKKNLSYSLQNDQFTAPDLVQTTSGAWYERVQQVGSKNVVISLDQMDEEDLFDLYALKEEVGSAPLIIDCFPDRSTIHKNFYNFLGRIGTEGTMTMVYDDIFEQSITIVEA